MDDQRAAPIDDFLEITEPDDPLFDAFWLPLYRRAFPDDERVPEDDHRSAATSPSQHVIVGMDHGAPISMARYDVAADGGGDYAYLMYMAVDENAVSRGHGRQMFGEIMRRLSSDPRGPRFLIFEVQRPGLAESTEPHQSADRRIDFYRRQGARVLEGVDYLQRVPGHGGVPMLIMARPLIDNVTPAEVFSAARDLFADDVRQTADPSFRR